MPIPTARPIRLRCRLGIEILLCAFIVGGCGGSKKSANQAPVARAGPDQTVAEGSLVQLDGSASGDPDGDALTFLWEQSGGLPVVLSDNSIAAPTFVAPGGGTLDARLTFTLVVGDGKHVSQADTSVVTVEVAAPPAGDGFQGILSAALSDGQFTFNNYWTKSDLDDQDVRTSIVYQGTKSPDRMHPFTTLVQQYWAKRRQCEEDSLLFHEPGSWANPVTREVYTFTDRRCYPTLEDRPYSVTPTVQASSSTVMHRYGYYCGAGYGAGGAGGAFKGAAPEPLDGVDYCCRLHDDQSWGANSNDVKYPTECGIVMCLGMASNLPADILELLPDVKEARKHWYEGASLLCPGNQKRIEDIPPIVAP